MIDQFSRFAAPIKQNFLGLFWLLLTVLMWAPQLSSAATLYVDKAGANNPSCSKSQPCLSIGYAIGRSKKNGKVIVGPGIYRENFNISLGLDGPLEGLKLESSAGRHATIIESESGNSVIHVSQPRVQIGKKGRGFTLRGADDDLDFGVEFVSHMDGVRIEGNSFTGNNYGIFAQGEKIQIRSNLFVDNALDDLTCSCERSIIRDNTFIQSGSVAISEFGESNTVDRNLSMFDGGYLSLHGERSKIVNNVVMDTETWGLRVNDTDGAIVQGNILTDNAQTGTTTSSLYVDQDTFSKSPRVVGNLIVGSGNYGMELDDLVGARIESNTVVQSDTYGIRLLNGVTNPVIRGNNTYFTNESANSCGLANLTGNALNYSKHFFAAGDGECGNLLSHIGAFPARPGPLKVNTAKKL